MPNFEYQRSTPLLHRCIIDTPVMYTSWNCKKSILYQSVFHFHQCDHVENTFSSKNLIRIFNDLYRYITCQNQLIFFLVLINPGTKKRITYRIHKYLPLLLYLKLGFIWSICGNLQNIRVLCKLKHYLCSDILLISLLW